MAELPTANDPYFRISYVASGNPQRARGLYAATTFREILVAMITNNLALPDVRFGNNLEAEAEAAGVQSQFQAPAINDTDLGTINSVYGAEAFCIALGAFAFVDRYYLLGTIDLAAVERIFYNFRDTGRVDEAKVRVRLDWLLANNHITQAQYNAFWNNW